MAERTAARAAVTPIDVNALLAERPVAGLAAHHPTMRERFGNAIYDLARWGGLGSIAHRMRQQGGLAADFLPGLGDVLALEDAAQDYGKGNYGMAAAGLGLAALGLVPGVGDAISAGARRIVRKTPTSFDVIVDGENVGSINLSDTHPYVSSVFVEPDFRGRGLGRDLYAAAEDAAGRPLVPSPLGLSDDAKKIWRKRLAGMSRAEAERLINESRSIGRGYGIKDEHISERLDGLIPSLGEL